MKYINILFSGALVLLSLVMFSGCYSSRTISQFVELEEAYINQDPIRALTIDSTLYTFDTFSFTDSTLSGKGSWMREGSPEDFEGALDFSEIVFIERLKSNGWKAFWIVPMTAAIAGGTITLLQPAEFTIWRSDGSSCPFIYSFNGSEYIMEAEAFSTAISQALETETFHVLPSLVSAEGELNIRISNERPETHLFNRVNLFAVDAKNSSSVVLDIQNNVWPVRNAKPPKVATGPAGDDILDDITKRDGRFWRSDIENVSFGSGFRDTLELQFELPRGKSEAILIVDAINSELITEVYAAAGAIIGDESLMFYRALEKDPDLKNYFLDWIQKSSLLVEVAAGNGWKEIGRLLPEANEVSFSRAIRLENLDHLESPLTVRISSMIDVWHIDAVLIDYSMEETLPMHPLNITSVKASVDESEVKEAISNSDSLYAMLMPPDYMNLTFASSPADEMQNPVYVMAAQGYLYEWFPDTKDKPSSIIPNWFKNIDRNEMLKFFIQREDMFLHSIYTEWSKEKR